MQRLEPRVGTSPSTSASLPDVSTASDRIRGLKSMMSPQILSGLAGCVDGPGMARSYLFPHSMELSSSSMRDCACKLLPLRHVEIFLSDGHKQTGSLVQRERGVEDGARRRRKEPSVTIRAAASVETVTPTVKALEDCPCYLRQYRQQLFPRYRHD